MKSFYRVGALLAALCLSAGAAKAEAFMIRGVNFDMTKEEQIEVLQNDGLKCVEREGWRVWSRVMDDTGRFRELDPREPTVYCFEDDHAFQNTVEYFDANLLTDWVELCATPTNYCTLKRGDILDELQEKVVVMIADEREIYFSCQYLQSCEFKFDEVVAGLEKAKGIKIDWDRGIPSDPDKRCTSTKNLQVCVNRRELSHRKPNSVSFTQEVPPSRGNPSDMKF